MGNNISIERFDRAVLEEIIASGTHHVVIKLANWRFSFNMASAGDEAEAELWAARKYGGGTYKHQTLQQAAIIARSLEKVGSADFSILNENDSLQEKYKFVSRLQPAYLAFLWEKYGEFRADQEAQFARITASGELKKSSPSQSSETTTETSASAAV